METPRGAHGQDERLIVAATLDAVEEGQTFEKLPPHMTVVRWFSFPEWRRGFLTNAMGRLTQQKPFQDMIGGKHAQYGEQHNIPVREMMDIEDAPYFSLHSLVQGMGKFRPDDPFRDTFNPHITDAPERSIAKGERVSMASLALFSTTHEMPLRIVEAAYPLNWNEPHEEING